MNVIVTEWPNIDKQTSPLFTESSKPTDLKETDLYTEEEHLYLPFTGNGYIGLSIISKQGLYANYQKTLSLPLMYSPLAQIYSDTLPKKGLEILISV